MGDLFGGPFFHAPVPPACRGTMGESHDGAYDSGGAPFGSWRCYTRSSVGRQKESASEFLVSP